MLTEDFSLHKQVITEILTKVRRDLLSEFIRVYLLQTNQTPLRTQMHTTVLSLYDQGDSSQKAILLNILWALWPQLSHYGKKGTCWDALSWGSHLDYVMYHAMSLYCWLADMFVYLMGHMMIQAEPAVYCWLAEICFFSCFSGHVCWFDGSHDHTDGASRRQKATVC